MACIMTVRIALVEVGTKKRLLYSIPFKLIVVGPIPCIEKYQTGQLMSKLLQISPCQRIHGLPN